MSVPLKFTISAPGKVILFGEHSVIYGKPCLAASINKRTTLNFETNGNNFIKIDIISLNFDVSIPLNTLNEWLNKNIITSVENASVYAPKMIDHVKISEMSLKFVQKFKKFCGNLNNDQSTSLQCIIHLLYCFFAFKKIPLTRSFKITVKTDLTIGAGTGSSASYSVCVAAALYHYFRIECPISYFDLKNFVQFTTEDKYYVNEWAFVCEQIIHGSPSGVDNFVCTFGSAVEVIYENETKNKSFEVLENILRLRILLVNTGVQRNTSILIKNVAQLYNKNQNILNIVFEAMGEISKTACSILKQSKNYTLNGNDDEFYPFYVKLEELISLNHGLLTSIGVSHETLNDIVSTTAKFGLRSKLTGAGGGGYAITLVPPYIPEENLKNCKIILESKGYTVDDITVGDIGVSII